jgi:hypothetical protein
MNGMGSRLILGTILYFTGPHMLHPLISDHSVCTSLKLYTTVGRTSQNGDVLANGIYLHYGHVGPMMHTRCLGQQSPSRNSGAAETEEKQNKRSKLTICP